MGSARKTVQELILVTLLLPGWEDERLVRTATCELGGDPRENAVLEPSKKPGNSVLLAVLRAAHGKDTMRTET